MKINRELFLQRLEAVDAGLATKEVVEQSSCFVFHGGRVMTFNGEIACATASPIPHLVGAVPAKHLKELLARLSDEDIDVEVEEGKLKIKSKRGRGSIALETEIAMPVEHIEEPGEWVDLAPDFCDAVALVQTCAAKDDNNYKLTCVHLTPTFVEACDNYQLSRYPIDTGLVGRSMVKRDSIKHVPSLGMVEVSEGDAWIHFRNPSGVVLSCRRWTEEYENLDDMVSNAEGQPATLPGGLAEAVGRSQVFSADNAAADVVEVRLKQGKMLIRGESVVGSWEEMKNVKYSGEPLSFLISPALLKEISGRAHDCVIGPTSLRINGAKFIYITCLEAAE